MRFSELKWSQQRLPSQISVVSENTTVCETAHVVLPHRLQYGGCVYVFECELPLSTAVCLFVQRYSD